MMHDKWYMMSVVSMYTNLLLLDLPLLLQLLPELLGPLLSLLQDTLCRLHGPHVPYLGHLLCEGLLLQHLDLLLQLYLQGVEGGVGGVRRVWEVRGCE